MTSFIYLYSKFTEEFLLLGGAAIFTLLSAYCYHWVVKRRRLGAARNQVPAGVVKAYLNQLINEAQFVRTQLFGLLAGDADPSKIQDLLLRPNLETGGLSPKANAAEFNAAPAGAPSPASSFSGSIPTDLLERLKALETQLASKEALVVNINVEKTKLLEEIENLKQNQKALQNSAATTASQDELLKKIKNLEERLEEYALFEDDLANLKRLQQENTSLKKRLEDSGVAATTVVPAGPAEPAVDTVVPATPIAEPQIELPRAESEAKKTSLDRNTIDSLLDGVSPIAPETSKPEPTIEPTLAPAIDAAPKKDDFEKLVDSVETSLNKPAPAPAASAPAPAAPQAPAVTAQAAAPAPATPTPAPEAQAKAAAPAASTPTPAPTPAPASPLSEKSDEELLKEFENLLNS